MAYFDNAATTLKPKIVVDKIYDAFDYVYSNFTNKDTILLEITATSSIICPLKNLVLQIINTLCS